METLATIAAKMAFLEEFDKRLSNLEKIVFEITKCKCGHSKNDHDKKGMCWAQGKGESPCKCMKFKLNK